MSPGFHKALVGNSDAGHEQKGYQNAHKGMSGGIGNGQIQRVRAAEDDKEEDPFTSTYVLQFSVSDSGVGIRKDHFEHILGTFRYLGAF